MSDLKIAAAYIRVSTEDQIEYSPDSQIKKIREYGKAHGYIIPDEYLFMDDGISGRTTEKRPAFNRMIGVAKTKPKPFDAILLWKFSRFARNREDSIVYKSMLRKQLGIDVISVSENIGDDKMSVIIEAIIEAMDEYYSINLAEEVRRGMAERASRGEIVTYAPFGYRVEDSKYVPDESNAPIVRMIYADYLAGGGFFDIARKVSAMGYRTRFGNAFEARNIEYILRNPVYVGKIRWMSTPREKRAPWNHTDSPEFDGIHEPLIDLDTWTAVQEKIAEQKRRYAKHMTVKKNPPFMLHGLVRCSECGSVLVRTGQGLQCARYARGRCTSHYISMPQIEEVVLEQIRSDFEGNVPDSLQINYTAVKPSETDDGTAAMIAAEKRKLQRVREAYEAGVDTLEEYRENKAKINRRLDELERQRVPKADLQKARHDFIQAVKNLLPALFDESTSEGEKNRILHQFVEKIVFDRENYLISVYYQI